MICANPLSLTHDDPESRHLTEHLYASPKLSWLMTRLGDIRQKGQKAIVFTEFREIQRLLQRAVAERLGSCSPDNQRKYRGRRTK